VKRARSESIDVRGMRQHVLTWGSPQAPKVFLLHGWMDVAASFQFMVDALAHEWFVIAPDLRGFGRSEWQPQVADRLQKTNPRLHRDKAEFLAAHWAETLADGSARLTSDPRHKLPFPTVYRMEEIYAVWRRITAPTLWVAALQSDIPKWLERHPEGEAGADGLDVVRRRIKHVPSATLVTIADAGHMLHHDQPVRVAAAIEQFLTA